VRRLPARPPRPRPGVVVWALLPLACASVGPPAAEAPAADPAIAAAAAVRTGTVSWRFEARSRLGGWTVERYARSDGPQLVMAPDAFTPTLVVQQWLRLPTSPPGTADTLAATLDGLARETPAAHTEGGADPDAAWRSWTSADGAVPSPAWDPRPALGEAGRLRQARREAMRALRAERGHVRARLRSALVGSALAGSDATLAHAAPVLARQVGLLEAGPLPPALVAAFDPRRAIYVAVGAAERATVLAAIDAAVPPGSPPAPETVDTTSTATDAAVETTPLSARVDVTLAGAAPHVGLGWALGRIHPEQRAALDLVGARLADLDPRVHAGVETHAGGSALLVMAPVRPAETASAAVARLRTHLAELAGTGPDPEPWQRARRRLGAAVWHSLDHPVARARMLGWTTAVLGRPEALGAYLDWIERGDLRSVQASLQDLLRRPSVQVEAAGAAP
jgi:hypothetical protein